MAKGKKTGGRVAGVSRNKDTLPIREVFDKFQYDPAIEIMKLIRSGTLEPEVALNAHLKLMKYVYRELTSLSINLDEQMIEQVKSYEEYLKSLNKE
jgi:hypothetical protein